MILENREYIACLSVIPITKSDFSSLEMRERIQTFMKSLGYRIGNYQQPLYDATKPNAILYISFDDDIKDEDVDLPYGNELIDAKVEEISDAYLYALDDYIGDDIVIPGRDELPVMVRVNNLKQYAYDNPIGKKKSNPISDTSIYEFEFPDGPIEEFAVNILSANII